MGDELHAQGGEMLLKILQQHYDQGSSIVGVTATPLDLAGEWDELVVAGTTSEGRACGALVPAYTYCPDEPDLKHIKNYRVGEDLTDRENSRAMMRPGVFGRVLTHWKRLNPEGKPTILFAPDVAGSIFFAEQFHRAGIRSAHIDAKQIWHAGEYLESDDETRHRILDMTTTGEVQVICNRFVLREGVDLPHLAHCIFACVFGSLKTYLQAGGRTLRAHPSMKAVCIQDHGGNYVRHGSLNEDREWGLGMSGYRVTGMRQEAMRERPETEPIICPKCGMARLSGPTCPACGHECHKRSRIVVQINGNLKMVEGPSFKPRRTAMKEDTQKTWDRYFYGARRKGRTANQAMAWMFYNEHYYPPKNLARMPVDPGDWYEKISDLPPERLR
jgi:ribosomal protein L32